MKMTILLLIIMTICGVSHGTVYKVGDSSGWTSQGTLQYKSWAASKNFHVGDTIVFEYNKEFHDVTRVTHANYNACNATAPRATWSTGNDSFTITKPGHYYFICGKPYHCEIGQKVDIRVPKPNSHGPSPSPLPSGPTPSGPVPSGPSPNSPPSDGPAPAPAPHAHKKNGSSALYSSWKLLLAALVIIGAIAY